MGKKIKRIIAKEGLIFIAITVILYFFFLYLGRHIPVIVPEYKLIFADGENYTIKIHPDMSYEDVSTPNNFLKTVQNPSPKLISKRTQEFIKLKNISSPFKEAKCVNRGILNLFNAGYAFLALNLFFKALIFYSLFLLARFIIWAVQMLREG